MRRATLNACANLARFATTGIMSRRLNGLVKKSVAVVGAALIRLAGDNVERLINE